MKIDGLDKLQKRLKKIQEEAKKMGGRRDVNIEEIFTPSFMVENTKFTSIEEMFDKSPFTVETNEDLENVSEVELDAFVSEHTSFDNWGSMLQSAGEEYTLKRLGF